MGSLAGRYKGGAGRRAANFFVPWIRFRIISKWSLVKKCVEADAAKKYYDVNSIDCILHLSTQCIAFNSGGYFIYTVWVIIIRQKKIRL